MYSAQFSVGDTIFVTLKARNIQSDSQNLEKALAVPGTMPLKVMLQGNFQLRSKLVLKRPNTVVDFQKNAVLTIAKSSEGAILIANDNITVKNGNIVGPGISTVDFYTGYGVLISGANNCSIKNMTISQIGGNGIYLANAGTRGCTDCNVFGNKIMKPAMALQGSDSFGILLGYSGVGYSHNGNFISNNIIDGDNLLRIGIGILGHGDGNIISGNVVRNMIDYGIMAYESQPIGGTLQRTIVENNTVQNIGGRGEVKNVKGAGIYLMKSHNSQISGNTVQDTQRNSDGSETLSQGAIATSGSEKLIINNNRIKQSGMYGIVCDFAFDSVIDNNIVEDTRKSAVYIINSNNVAITANTFKNIGEVVIKGNFNNTGKKEYSTFNLLKKYLNIETGTDISVKGNTFMDPRDILYFYAVPDRQYQNIIKNIAVESNRFYNIKNYRNLIHISNSDVNTIKITDNSLH